MLTKIIYAGFGYGDNIFDVTSSVCELYISNQNADKGYPFVADKGIFGDPFNNSGNPKYILFIVWMDEWGMLKSDLTEIGDYNENELYLPNLKVNAQS